MSFRRAQSTDYILISTLIFCLNFEALKKLKKLFVYYLHISLNTKKKVFDVNVFYGIGTLSKVVLNIISSYRQHSNIAVRTVENNPGPGRPPENTVLGRNCRPYSPHSRSLIAAKASQNAHTLFFSYW